MSGLAAVAIDLDGTLLRDDKSYDRPRFLWLVARLRAIGCRVVVASGNNIQLINRYFGDEVEHFGVVSDNGALVGVDGIRLFAAEVDRRTLGRVVDVADRHPDIACMLSGIGVSYAPRRIPGALLEVADRYYPERVAVDDLRTVEDRVVKATFITRPGHSDDVYRQVAPELADVLRAVTSGHIAVDLMVPGLSKGTGLGHLADHWGVALEHMVAFGDAANDLEMLVEVGRGYAMENSVPEVLAAVDRRAPSNNRSGVLTVVEELLCEVEAGHS